MFHRFLCQVPWYNWHNSQPDNGNNGPKDCAWLIGGHSSWKGKWNLKYCEQNVFFICKANATIQGVHKLNQIDIVRDLMNNGLQIVLPTLQIYQKCERLS